MKKYLLNLTLVMSLIVSSCMMFTGCKFPTRDDPPYVYTALDLMYDGYSILDFYTEDFDITKIGYNMKVDTEECGYSSCREKTMDIISESYSYWEYCEDGGTDYTEQDGSIYRRYTFQFDGQICNVEYYFQDNSSVPTSTGFRIVRNYDIIFFDNHISICYENEDESFHDKTKHYIDVYAVKDGIFIQYYLKQYNGDFFSTYTHTVYQLYYHQITDRFYYDVKTTTSELDSIIPIDFENFILPEFMYVFDDK